MSEYLKPQSPLYHKKEDTYFYPLTTVDQVIMDDGNRLGRFNLLSIDKNDVNEGEPNLVNADTLDGYSAEEFARKEDLSDYAKLSDLENIDTGITMKLLWENASPESEFVEQAVNLDLDEYDFVQVAFMASPGASTHIATGFIRINSDTYCEGYYTNSGDYLKRNFRANAGSGLYFENGKQNSTSGAGYMIPYQIYGIKEVSV